MKPAGRLPALSMAPPATRAAMIADAICAAMVAGDLLPGDVLREPAVAAQVKASRIPVREAFRLLEAQGIMASDPFKGARLAPVRNAEVRALASVRESMEVEALDAILVAADSRDRLGRLTGGFERAVERLRGKPRGEAEAGVDRAWLEAVFVLSPDPPLPAVAQIVVRQSAVLLGLAKGIPDLTLDGLVMDRAAVLAALWKGHGPASGEAVRHALRWLRETDFEAVVAERRRRAEGAA